MASAGVASRCVVVVAEESVVALDEVLLALGLGELVALERIQHAPAGDDEGEPGIHVRRFRERQGAIARIVGSHRRQQHLMPAARRAVGADPVGAAAELARMRLQPADAVIDVLQRRRIGRLGRIAEIDRQHHDAGGREIERGVLAVGAVLVVPGAAVDLEHRRERAGSRRLIEPRQPRLAAAALVDDVLDHEFISCFGARILGLRGADPDIIAPPNIAAPDCSSARRPIRFVMSPPKFCR